MWKTYYFCILFIKACKTAFTSAVFCVPKVGLRIDDNNGAILEASDPTWCSGGPTSVITSGKIDSSVANVLDNWSRRLLRGSVFVGDKQVSNIDFGSDVRLNECFFLPLGVLLDARNNLFRFSTVSFSRGGLPVFCGSEFGASGSVLPAPPSLPELSPRHSFPPLRSVVLFYKKCRILVRKI